MSHASSHDRMSGVWTYNKLYIPSEEKNGQTKLFYIPQIGYFLVVLTDSKFELYQVDNDQKQLLPLM